jgi:hypothetical protein
MTRPDRKMLWKSVLRLTGRDPSRVGYWLRRHRRSEGLRPAALARQLGIGLKKLVLLSLCQAPQERHFREDLAAICRRTGANEEALSRVLRQEQALAHWSECPPANRGWLMAASDAAPEGSDAEGGDADPPKEPDES